MELDRFVEDHVAGHSVIRADVGVLGRELIIISGIACPGWKIDDDHTHREPCVLKLRERVDHLEQWTVSVGLASISNDDTEYVFATDNAELSVDDSGELVLTTSLALMGEWSALPRFGYQVVCTSRRVSSFISGTITWPSDLFRPTTPDPAGASGLFTILANEHQIIKGKPDPGGFGVDDKEILTPVSPGEVIAVRVGATECSADYRIVEPPKGKRLKVTVRQHRIKTQPTWTVTVDPVNAGTDLMTLTPLQPVRSDVDFKVALKKGPK